MIKILGYSLVCTVILNSCLPNKLSRKTRNEEVSLVIIRPDSNLKSDLLASAVPEAFSAVTSIIKKGLEKEAEKYRAEYDAKIVNDTFYRGNKMDVLGVELIRTVRLKARRDTAAHLKFGFFPSADKKFIHVKPTYIKISYTKNKLRRNDNDLDLTIRFIMNSAWVNSKNKYFVREVANVDFEIPDIKLNTVYQHNKIKPKWKSDWFIAVPRSVLGNDLGLGNYSIYLRVKEVDDAGTRFKKIADFIGNKQEAVEDALKDQDDDSKGENEKEKER